MGVSLKFVFIVFLKFLKIVEQTFQFQTSVQANQNRRVYRLHVPVVERRRRSRQSELVGYDCSLRCGVPVAFGDSLQLLRWRVYRRIQH